MKTTHEIEHENAELRRMNQLLKQQLKMALMAIAENQTERIKGKRAA